MFVMLAWLAAVLAADGVRLQGYDALALAGSEVMVRAKLERDGALGTHPDWTGQRLQFLVDGEPLGHATTSTDGIATLPWTTPGLREGEPNRVFHLTVRLRDADGSVRAQGAFVITTVTADRPILVVDLDGTVCLGSFRQVKDKPPAEVPAFEGAALALNRLAVYYQVLYLTARDDALMDRSRSWLQHHGFPGQPVLVRDLTLTNLSAESFKSGRLKTLAGRFRLAAGVGDREEDAEAYLDHGMYAILIGDEDDVPERASKVTTWAEVERLLTPPVPRLGIR